MAEIIYSFTSPPLFSPFPSLPVRFLLRLKKRGQLGGNGDKAGFISDVGGKNTGVDTIFVSGHTVDSRR